MTDIPTVGDALAELEADAAAAETTTPGEAEATEEGDKTEPPRGKDGKFTKPNKTPKQPAKPEKSGVAAKPAKPEPRKAVVVEPEEPEEGELKEDFSDERPWTPERVKAAAAEARQLARKSQAMWATEQKRAAKLKQGRDEYLREKQQFVAVRDHFATDVQMLRTAAPRERLEALGRLTGSDPIQLWEELSVEMARGGKKTETAKPSAEVLELREQLKELKGYLQGKAQQDQAAQEAAFIAQRKAELASLASASDDDGETMYPYLSDFEPEEVGEALAEVLTQVYNETGKRISDAKAAQILEQRLQQQAERLERVKAKRAGGAPQGASGLETRAKANPGQAQSPPPNRGRSLAPGLSTHTGSKRVLSTEEVEEDAADFIPASLLAFANG